MPLVSENNMYKVVYDKGTHSEAPWVTIINPDTKDVLYNGEPNIGFKRGSTDETVILTTDLCGKPLQMKKGVN